MPELPRLENIVTEMLLLSLTLRTSARGAFKLAAVVGQLW